MNRLLVLAFLAAIGAQAQDLAITNAHIVVGNGMVINQGSVIVRAGRIASVAQGSGDTKGLRAIDAEGMTLMPGFIDAHRHIINGNPQQWLKD
jgi:imidazolonepropionase-like amidohydrolase